jgi:protocadherin alpha
MCASVQNPQTSSTVDQNNGFDVNNQLRPQVVTANLRAGNPQTYDFTMRLAPNFPLDVYFLMDFSRSMEQDLGRLRNTADDILTTIQGITSNFQVGFGSFVDKPTHPYFLPGSETPSQTCIADNTCTAPYVFRNHQSLDGDPALFRNAINNAQISSNFDGPESTLDAMVQVLACRTQIGWRAPPARHMLIVITDAGFHVAGDGKLGAAVKRNTGVCRLDSGFYTGTPSITYDYPSVGLVANLLRREFVIPIFMITNNQAVQATYSSLINAFQRGTFSFLINGATDVNRVIVETYNNISTRITLRSDAIEGLNVSVVMDCAAGGASQGTSPNECEGVSVGQNISIRVTLAIDKCTEDLRNGVVLSITDDFTGTIQFNVNGLCSCPCESTRVNNSALCSSMGDRVCGVCVCNPGRYGRTCACIDEDINDGITPSDICQNGPNGLECSGRGICNCGSCDNCSLVEGQTNERYYGDTCECDNVNCPRDENNVTCSGRGNCQCGVCVCSNDFFGTRCECEPSTGPLCTKPGETAACGGRGSCTCGGCDCTGTEYRGQYCDLCTTVETCGPVHTCNDFTACVACVFEVRENSLTRTRNNCSVQCETIDNIIQVNNMGQIPSTQRRVLECNSPLSGDRCRVDYYFTVTRTTRDIYVVSTLQDCLQIPIWAIAIAIFVAFVILAIILILLLRLIIYILDWREYKKFQKEVAGTQFGENINPLYHQPETQHANPLFAGKNPPKEPVKDQGMDLPEKKPL